MNDLTEFKVSAVVFDKVKDSPMVFLENKKLNRVIPIWIGTCEALSIAMILNNEKYPRPLTHDLLLNIINKLELDIKSVIIYQIKDEVFYSKIIIDNFSEEDSMEVDARPSDAIALALKEKAKIYVDSSVILEAGVAIKPPKNYEKDFRSFLKKIEKQKGDRGNANDADRNN